MKIAPLFSLITAIAFASSARTAELPPLAIPGKAALISLELRICIGTTVTTAAGTIRPFASEAGRVSGSARETRWNFTTLPATLAKLACDPGEMSDLASRHPDVVASIERIMKNAVTPSERYEVGKRYRGSPIWKRQ